MEAGGVEVDLDFAQHVDVGLAGEFAAAQIAERDVFVGVLGLAVDGDLAVELALAQERLDEYVVARLAVDVADDGEIEAGALDDVEGEAGDGRLDLGVAFLGSCGLLREVVDVRDALFRDGNVFHSEGLKVGDAAAERALDQEGVADGLQAGRDPGCPEGFEFVAAEVDRVVVLGFHDGFLALAAELAEGVAVDLALEFEFVEEGLQHLELADDGIGGEAVGRQVVGPDAFVEVFVFVDVEVLVVEELAEFEQLLVVEFLGGKVAEALDGEVALEFVGNDGDVGTAAFADDPVALGSFDVFVEGRDEGLGIFTDSLDWDFVALDETVHDFGVEVEALLHHLFVGALDQIFFGRDGVEELAVVNRAFGLEFALGGEFGEVFEAGFDAGAMEDVGGSAVGQAKPDPDGAFGFLGPQEKNGSYHKSSSFFRCANIVILHNRFTILHNNLH